MKVCVIGLDGATLDLVEPWVQQGLLPTFAKLISTGTWGRLRSTIPPLTAPAWTSFMTGKNPGKHGLFEFAGRRSNSYETRPFNASHRDGESLWSILGRAGKKVCVLNVPMTYPPEPVSGYLVSGMGTPATTDDFCYPADLLVELRKVVPSYEVQREGVFDPRGREADMLEAVRDMTEMRRQAVSYMMKHVKWDFFMAVFMASDLVAHYFWHYMDSAHTLHDPDAARETKLAIRNCYQQLDDCLASVLGDLDDETVFIVMSDHGFGIQEKYLHMNTWLWQQGYLQVKRSLATRAKETLFRLGVTPVSVYEVLRALRHGGTMARGIRRNKTLVRDVINRVFLSFRDVDWERTRAYSIGNVGQIFVNFRGREPCGVVLPGPEYESLLVELTDELMSLRDPDSGEAIIDRVTRREDVYQGDHLDQAPDLLIVPRSMKYTGYGELQFSTNKWLVRSDRTGGHRPDGLVALIGRGLRGNHKLAGARIIDLAPTILAAMDVAIPMDMDGRVLEQAFTPEARSAFNVRYSAPGLQLDHRTTDLSEQEEIDILERLGGLGYVS